MAPKKKTLKDRTEERKKYRIKKTTRDVNAICGTDYTPEMFLEEAEKWIELSPPCYSEEDAVSVLKQRRAIEDVRVEYIYPEL